MKDEGELDMLGSRRRNFQRGDSMWEGSEASRRNVAHSGNWGKIPVTEGSSRGDGQATTARAMLARV